MRFDEYRPLDLVLHREPGRIEALEVADLQHELLRVGQRNQFVGLRDGDGDRLFRQHMHAGSEAVARHGVMCFGGAGDRDQIDFWVGSEQLAVTGESGHAKFFRHAVRGLRVGIDHADQFDAGIRRAERGIFLGMKAAEIADADDGGTEWSRHRR